MATQAESQANIDKFLAAGGTQDILAKEKYGGKLSSGELSTFLTKYGLTGGASNVYSADNIQAASQETTYPTDLLGIRNQIYGELGVTTAQEAYNTAYKDYQDFLTEQDTQQNLLENQTISLNVIRGEQAEASRLGAITQSAKARGLDVIQKDLSSKMTEAEAQYTIRAGELQEKRQLMLQYPSAGISLTDSYESAADKIAKYQSKQELKQIQLQYPGAKITEGMSTKEITKAIEKYNEKQAIKQLYMTTFGSSGKGKSTKEMENKLKKNYKSNKAYEDEMNALKLVAAKKSLASGKSQTEKTDAAFEKDSKVLRRKSYERKDEP